MAVSELGLALLRAQQTQRLSERELAAAIGVNRSVVIGLTADKESPAYSIPRLPTLEKIAAWLSVPMWRALEMCGYTSGVSSSDDALATRLASLVNEFPQLRERLSELTELPADQLLQVLNFASYLRDQRQGVVPAESVASETRAPGIG